jgi:hypothetical protein
MIIFIFIFVFIIIIALIVFVISNGKGNSKDNKKFTFQYKHNNHNNHNYSSLFPYAPTAPNKQENQYAPTAPNEQENRYTPLAPNEQEKRYTPSPQSPPPQPPPPPKVPTEKVPTEKVPTEKVPTEKVPTEKVPTEKVPTEKVPTEKVSTEKVPTEKVSISESNIHNCEANYTWNKYLKKCITTECPIVHSVCPSKIWKLPYSMASQLSNYDHMYPVATNGTIECSQFYDVMPTPELREQICEYLNIPVPEQDEVCWSECQNKCIKPECSEMTMETCRIMPDGPSNTIMSPLWTKIYDLGGLNVPGLTCEQFSTLSPEFQLQLQKTGGSNLTNTVLPGEICWSDVCNKCVKPYVKPIQPHLKHQLNPACFPTSKTCNMFLKVGADWSYPYWTDSPSGYIETNVNVPNETCEAWSTFTEWEKYNLNPLVLPGEICYNPCGVGGLGGCIAPLPY